MYQAVLSHRFSIISRGSEALQNITGVCRVTVSRRSREEKEGEAAREERLVEPRGGEAGRRALSLPSQRALSFAPVLDVVGETCRALSGKQALREGVMAAAGPSRSTWEGRARAPSSSSRLNRQSGLPHRRQAPGRLTREAQKGRQL